MKDVGANRIISILNENGFEAYIVGGAVRNALLDFAISDYDIVTNAFPQEVVSIFPRTIPTGLKHGTVTVLENGSSYEVTTMRTEGAYNDLRHPDEVVFIKNLEEDLKRRDFTINAMAWDSKKKEVIDYFEGMKDLQHRLIRTVGNPDDRFSEDALRLLRAVRFATQYNFNIESETMISIAKNAEKLNRVSVERIYQELYKILMSDHPGRGITLLLYSGILKVILPELLPMAGFQQFSNYHDKDVFFHTVSVLDNTEKDIILRLSALFHDSGKPQSYFIGEDESGHFYNHEDISREIANKALIRLKVDKKTRHMVELLISKHMVPLDINKDYKIKKLINSFGKDKINLFFKFKRADYGGKPLDEESINKFRKLFKKVNSIIENEEPLTLKDLNITGDEITSEKIKNGPLIGEILNYLLEEVLKNPALNKKHKLKELSEKYIKNKGIY